MTPNTQSERIADPLIDEVRAIRADIVGESGNDLDRLCDHLQELERQHADRMVKPESVGDRDPAD